MTGRVRGDASLCHSVGGRNPGLSQRRLGYRLRPYVGQGSRLLSFFYNSEYKIRNLDPCLRKDDKERRCHSVERRNPGLFPFFYNTECGTQNADLDPRLRGGDMGRGCHSVGGRNPGLSQRRLGSRFMVLDTKCRIQNADLDPRLRGDDNFLTFEK